MKKGLSLVLSLLIVISGISCLGVVASATNYTVYANQWYTVDSDDCCYFTAPVYGNYRFYSDGYGDPKIYIYNDYGEEITASDDVNDLDFDVTLTLAAGESVTCEFYNYDEGEQCRFQITYEEILLDYAYLDTWCSVLSRSSVYFTAPSDGMYNFRSNGNGDPKVTIYDLDGYELAEFDDDVGRDFDGDLYLSAGETIELYLYNYDGSNYYCNFIITKTKSVVSAQYIGATAYLEEYSNGYWEIDEYGNRYFYYDVYGSDFNVVGNYIYVTYDTGETDSFIFDYDYGDYINIKGESLGYDGFSTKQSEQHWYKGANNYLTIYFNDFECLVPVCVVSSSNSSKSVQSISYSYGSTPIQVIYGVDGEYNYDENNSRYFYYDSFRISQFGSSLVVRYTDGTSETYTYVREKGFVTANNKQLPLPLNYYTNQDVVHWGMGTNYLTIEYGGATCQIPVQVIDNPYSTVEFHYADNTLYENAEEWDGYWTYDDNNNKYFRYYTNVYEKGNYIKVYYKSSGYSIFYYDENYGEFIDSYGNIYTHSLGYETTQSANHWYLFGTYPVNFTIAGINTTAYLKVVENPVASFVLTPAYQLTYYEGSNCWVNYDQNNNPYYYYETPYSFELMYREGTTFTVYYKNGTNKVYRYNSNLESFVDANGNGFEGSLTWYTNQENNHWYVGQNYINIDYMGVKGNIPVQVLPANQTPGRWLTYNADYDEWFCMLGSYMDQTYNGLVYYDGAYYYVSSGAIDWSFSGVVAYGGSFYYVTNGVLNWNYTGLGKYEGQWYYVENGMINWGGTGLVNAYNQWYYVEGGFLNPYKDTLAFYNGVWYSVDDGKINWVGNRLVDYNGAWYYVENGEVNWYYTGLAQHGTEWYYVANGMLDWGYTGLVNYGGTWYYVTNGYLDWNASGITYYNGVYYYVENGELNWNCDTLAMYNGDWYYVYGGSIAWGYTGLVLYNGTYYYVENGYLNWNCNTLTQYNGDWYYVYGGSLANWYTGLVLYNGTYYYVENGYLNWNCNTLTQYNGDWYYVYGGSIAWNYTGYVNYNGVNYYITNGYLNWANN